MCPSTISLNSKKWLSSSEVVLILIAVMRAKVVLAQNDLRLAAAYHSMCNPHLLLSFLEHG